MRKATRLQKKRKIQNIITNAIVFKTKIRHGAMTEKEQLAFLYQTSRVANFKLYE